MKNLRMQQEMTDRGRLEIRVNARIQARPVSGARVTVSYTGDPQNVIEELITDGDGVNGSNGVRGVVSLSSESKLLGSGTYNDVYTVN